MNDLKILVFGRSGQVSDELARLSARRGEPMEFVGLPDFDLTQGDPGDVIRGVRPDAVINAAAYTAVDRAEGDAETAFRLNATIVEMMAGAAREVGARLVHISTDYVFDGRKARPYVEEDATGPLGVYGASKLAGEQAALRDGTDAVVLRTAWVVSPFGVNFVKTMLRLAGERDELAVVDDQWGRPTYAGDIAAMCYEAARRRELRGLYHFCGADDATWADVAEHVFQHVLERTGRRPALRRITTSEYPTPARRPANSRLDTSRLQVEADWAPRPWRDAVDLCLSELELAPAAAASR